MIYYGIGRIVEMFDIAAARLDILVFISISHFTELILTFPF